MREKELIEIKKHINFFYKKAIQKQLILYFDYIFSYGSQGESTHKAKTFFEDTDIDSVEFMVLSSTNNSFRGKFLSLEEFLSTYKNSEFEIITETYNWRRAVFQGWLWSEDKTVNCTLNIYFEGKMLYEIEE